VQLVEVQPGKAVSPSVLVNWICKKMTEEGLTAGPVKQWPVSDLIRLRVRAKYLRDTAAVRAEFVEA
jgi:hypothetical protein